MGRKIQCKHKQIPFLNSYKYLGVNLDTALTLNYELIRLKETINKIIKRLNNLSTKKTSVYLKLSLYKVLILSQIKYNSILYLKIMNN